MPTRRPISLILTLWNLKRWSLFAMALWAVAGIAAAGIAPIAYSDDGSNRRAAVATIVVLGVGLGILVAHTRRTLRRLRVRESPHEPRRQAGRSGCPNHRPERTRHCAAHGSVV